MSRKFSGKVQQSKPTAIHRPTELTESDLADIAQMIRMELHASTKVRPSNIELEQIVEVIRTELKLSFWQCAALSLFIFILSLFVAVLVVLLQRQ